MTSVALDCTCDALVLGDASCVGIRQLLDASHLPAAKLTPDLSPLEGISAALQQQRAKGRAVRRLHLIAHGDPGVVWVGDQAIDRAALLAYAEALASWGVEQIALWSCHVGADVDFIALLEALTGALVLCSQGSIGASAVVGFTFGFGFFDRFDLPGDSARGEWGEVSCEHVTSSARPAVYSSPSRARAQGLPPRVPLYFSSSECSPRA